MRPLLAAATACLLLTAAEVRAEDAGADADGLSVAGVELDLYASRALGRNMDQPRCGVTSDAKFLGPARILGVRGEARPFERLAVFAASRGYRLGISAPLYDVEGGAALELLRGLELTGGYRVLGLGLVRGDAPERSESALLGLRLSF
jgi:hypothetical protein